MLDGGPRYAAMDLNNHNYDFSRGLYHKLGEDTNMFVDSFASLLASSVGGSDTMSVDNNSSVASNESHTHILIHRGLRRRVDDNYTAQHSVCHKGRVTHALSDDALARGLFDSGTPTQGLENFEEWSIELRKLYMGKAFAQGAFGKLYRGTYSGEDVAIKILESLDNDLEKALLMEQQFQQEIMMLATLNHPNIVRFIGGCRKPMLWCIVTEYAKGGSVGQFLMSRRSASSSKTGYQASVRCGKGDGICSSAWTDTQGPKI